MKVLPTGSCDRFNPCFDGSEARAFLLTLSARTSLVSILVLMEVKREYQDHFGLPECA